MMKVVVGDLVDMAMDGHFDVIVHGCNCFHTMGAGIAARVRMAFPSAYRADLDTVRGDRSKLGTYSMAPIPIRVMKDDTLMVKHFTILNAYTQYSTSRNGEDVFEYDALVTVLERINHGFPGAKVGIPLIGGGLAAGDVPRILTIMAQAGGDMDLTLVMYGR